jgi:hypothetical protein
LLLKIPRFTVRILDQIRRAEKEGRREHIQARWLEAKLGGMHEEQLVENGVKL